MSPEVMAAVYGVMAAAAYGTGDFSGGLASKKSSVYAVIVLSQAVGFTLYVVLALIAHEAAPSILEVLLAMSAGLIGVIGLLALYTSLARGQMGIAAPVAGVLTAAIPVAVGMIAQGVPKPLVLLGFAVGLLAVWLVARAPGSERINPRVLILPATAGICFGIGFTLFVQASQHAIYVPLMCGRFASMTALSLFVGITRKPFTVASKRALPLIVFSGVLDAGGNGLYLLAAHAGRIDIAAVLSSLYPAATVLLAWLVLRERLNRIQGIGVLAALIAIALIVA